MDKVNYKAVMLVFLFQILAAIAWYSLVLPLLFEDDAVLGIFLQSASITMALLFFGSTFIQVSFIAWFLVRVKGSSALGRFFWVIGVWLFVVLPNYIVLNLFLGLGVLEGIYLLSYSAVSCLIAALILPFWRSSRSIFKD